MLVGVPVVHMMLLCVMVRRVGWLACGGRLRWDVAVMQLVGVAVVFGHQGVGVGGGQGRGDGEWCLLVWGGAGGAAGGGGVLPVGPGAVDARAWPPVGQWGRTVAGVS